MNTAQSEIARLKELIDTLLVAYNEKVNLLNVYKEKNDQLLKEADDYKQKLKEEKQKTETLKIAKTLSLSKDDKNEVIKKINKIVKEIDVSIGLLNQ